jgi:glycosyltransferase involved in cell wall biosynthesis
MRALLSSLGLGSMARSMLGIRLGRFHQYAARPLSAIRFNGSGDSRDLPTISIVTPSLNQGHFIRTTIESVLGQNYPGLQYVVQDAHSTDETAAILDEYSRQGVDVRIERDSGQTDALNRGFARTDGEVMAYLNSDDYLLPGVLSFVGRYFRDHADVDVIYGNRLIVDEIGMEIGRWVLPAHNEDVLRRIDYVPQETMFWRRRLWDRAGSHFDTDMQFAMDWELILRFMSVDAVFQHLPMLFGVFRVHGSQKSQVDFLRHGAKEMTDLKSRYSNNKSGFGQIVAAHWAYLAQHRQADAAFESSMGENG